MFVLQASKTLVQEKERVIALRDQEITLMQKELTKLKRQNETLTARLNKRPSSAVSTGRSGSELEKQTNEKAAAIKLDRG